MTRIRARCPGCGDVEFGIDDIVVIGAARVATTYRFDCPSCGDPVSRSAVPDVIELLLSAGVRRESRPEHEPVPTVIDEDPITENDVESFKDLLRNPDWFAQLEATLRDQ